MVFRILREHTARKPNERTSLDWKPMFAARCQDLYSMREVPDNIYCGGEKKLICCEVRVHVEQLIASNSQERS